MPEWYFLPFYAILRSTPDILFIPAKLAGVLLMFGSIGVLFILPWLDTSPVRSGRFRPVFKWLFVVTVLDMFMLGYVGAHRPDAVIMGLPITTFGLLGTIWYFLFFLIILPILGKFERPLPLPTSISEAVLKKSSGATAGAGLEKR